MIDPSCTLLPGPQAVVDESAARPPGSVHGHACERMAKAAATDETEDRGRGMANGCCGLAGCGVIPRRRGGQDRGHGGRRASGRLPWARLSRCRGQGGGTAAGHSGTNESVGGRGGVPVDGALVLWDEAAGRPRARAADELARYCSVAAAAVDRAV